MTTQADMSAAAPASELERAIAECRQRLERNSADAVPAPGASEETLRALAAGCMDNGAALEELARRCLIEGYCRAMAAVSKLEENALATCAIAGMLAADPETTTPPLPPHRYAALAPEPDFDPDAQPGRRDDDPELLASECDHCGTPAVCRKDSDGCWWCGRCRRPGGREPDA